MTSPLLPLEFPKTNIEIIKIKNNLANQPKAHIKIVEIRNCPTTLDASNLLSNAVFRPIIEDLENFVMIQLKINEKLNFKHTERIKEIKFKLKKNFLISYESTIDAGQTIIYWKIGDLGKFVTIMMMEIFSVEMSNFLRELLTEIVDSGEIFELLISEYFCLRSFC